MALTASGAPFSLPALHGSVTKFDTRQSSVSGQLSAGHYIPANYQLYAVYPRPDIEVNSFAVHRRWYVGIPYEIPLEGVIGGAAPYSHILGAECPSGMTIISKTRFLDNKTFYYIYWASPPAGSYTVVVHTIDQEQNVITRRWSLSVGTAGFIFIDSASGVDANRGTTGGTLAAPFATFDYAWVDAATDTTFSNYTVLLRAGTYSSAFSPAIGRNNTTDNKPSAILPYPGESVTFTGTGGLFEIRGDDVFIGEILFSGDKTTQTNSCFMQVLGAGSRLTLGASATNLSKGLNGTDNPAVLRTIAAGSARMHLFVYKSDVTDTAVQYTALFYYKYFKISGVSINNNGSSKTTIGHNGSAGIAIKSDCRFGEVSNNDIRNMNTDYGLYTAYGQEVAARQKFDDVEFRYNIGVAPVITQKAFEYPDTVNVFGSNRNVKINRNSFYGVISAGGTDYLSTMALNNDVVVNNNTPVILASGANRVVTSTNDLVGDGAAGILDANGLLTGASRTSYLGVRGAEIA